jgi:hypothetical protein
MAKNSVIRGGNSLFWVAAGFFFSFAGSGGGWGATLGAREGGCEGAGGGGRVGMGGGRSWVRMGLIPYWA